MILNNKDAMSRLESPMNLINRLRSTASPKNNAMSLFGIGNNKTTTQKKIVEVKTFNPFIVSETASQKIESLEPLGLEKTESSLQILPTTIDNLISNSDNQVKLSLAHDRALGILNEAMSELSIRLNEVKADKLPSIITATSKVVESIRKERILSRANGSEREVHYHFYTPEQRKISDYEIIDVGVPAQ
jgi:hypothetical protein